jgi:hypothetical protein
MLAALFLSGCFEVIDHTPVASCARDSDCACGTDCYVADGGDLPTCGPHIRTTCASGADCHNSDAGPSCLHLVRDGGACNYLQCQ